MKKWDAKIFPSNENYSTIFTGHSFEKNIHFKKILKAKDHNEGNEWVEKLKEVSQSQIYPVQSKTKHTNA